MPVPNSIAALGPEYAAWRQDFHQHPELAYAETRTAGIVAEKLRGFGCDAVIEGLGGTGVIGLIHGRAGPGGQDRSILLRADMDALPMREENDFEHASKVPGAMHACGHDGHTTMLLAAAKHLAETRAFDGTAVLVFQPAEEKGAGAAAMIRDGLLEKHLVRAAFALHNFPGLPIGAFAVAAGPVCAAVEDFVVRIKGVGGHAAYPHQTADAIVAAGQFVSAAQTIVSRGVDPFAQAVVSITSIDGGSSFNVIPQEVRLQGTARSFDPAVGAMLLERLQAVGAGVGQTVGVEVRIAIEPNGYPSTVNDAAETAFARQVAQELVGAEAVVETGPEMGAEDFAFILREVPGAFIGVGNGDSAPLHHPNFDFNDAATPFGAAFLVRLIERGLPPTL